MVHVGLFLSTRRKKHPDLSVDDFCQQVRLPQNRKKLQEGRQKLIAIRAARGGKARFSQKDIHDIGELITVQKRKSDQLEIIDPDDLFLTESQFFARKGYRPDDVGMFMEWHTKNNGMCCGTVGVRSSPLRFCVAMVPLHRLSSALHLRTRIYIHVNAHTRW